MGNEISTLVVEEHPGCVACGPENMSGLLLSFHRDATGVVTAEWMPTSRWEGFKGLIHGGILTTLLDEAMAKAVIALGIPALTCELRVRFRAAVRSGTPLTIRGWVTEHRGRRTLTEASLVTAAGECVHAWGTFIRVACT